LRSATVFIPLWGNKNLFSSQNLWLCLWRSRRESENNFYPADKSGVLRQKVVLCRNRRVSGKLTTSTLGKKFSRRSAPPSGRASARTVGEKIFKKIYLTGSKEERKIRLWGP